MALLRLPGISLQILGHQSDHKCPNSRVSLTNFSLSWSTTAPLCRLHRHGTFPDSVPSKSRNLRSSFTSYFSATTQEPVLESSSSAVISSTEEEISKTRLIAQNVPWTSTPEDIRSLFEKYGNVVDVEVFPLWTFGKALNISCCFSNESFIWICRCLCIRRKGIEVWFSLKWVPLRKLLQLLKLSNPM